MSRVTLEDWEYENAVFVAQNRHANNRNVPDAADYDMSRMEDNLRADIASACCEIAVAKLLGAYWVGGHWQRSEHHKYNELPDVMPNIEVKRIRERTHNLLAKKRYVGKGLALVCAYVDPNNMRNVDVIGWKYADDAWEIGRPVDWDATGGIRLVPQSELEPL